MPEAHPIQFFEYLLALRRLTTPVVRNVQDYKEKLWWQTELPLGDGCSIFGNNPEEEAWLVVRKQTVEPAPPPPFELEEWLLDRGLEPDRPPIVHPELPLEHQYPKEFSILSNQKRQSSIQEAPSVNSIKFEDSPRRVASWNSWLKTVWEPWAVRTLPKVKIQRLYGELFALYQRLQREADAIELVWGHGLFTWNINGHKVCRPLLTTRLELLFDAQAGMFSIAPAGSDTILELDMLSGMELPNLEYIAGFERMINTAGIDPWDTALVNEFFKELAETLSPESETKLGKHYSLREAALAKHPIIYNAPLLLLRRRTGRQWETELQAIVESIRSGGTAPAPIQCLVNTEAVNFDAKVKEDWRAVGEDLLFPLPSNEDQKEIIRRLSQNIGVVVQGPPGTGKSHTIVNLVAHLLAHGKRVLVTSQTERALKVLGEMIAKKLPEISPLCVSVLGGDARSIAELDNSVAKICEHLDSMNSPEDHQEYIQDLKHQLDSCQHMIAALRTELGQAHEMESSTSRFCIDGKSLPPIDIAAWLAENQPALGWIPDMIDDTVLPPLTEVEMVELFRLFQEISAEDERALSLCRPQVAMLESAASLQVKNGDLERLKSAEKQREELLRGWSFETGDSNAVAEIIRIVAEAEKNLSALADGWLVQALEDILKGGQRRAYWEEVMKDCLERIQQIRQMSMKLAEYTLQIPPIEDLRQFADDLKVLKAEYEKNGKPGFMFKHLTGKSKLYILETCRINGSALKNVTDLNILLLYAEQCDAKKKLTAKWNNSVNPVAGPLLQESDLRLLETLESYMEKLQIAFAWQGKNLPKLESCLHQIQPHGVVEWTNLSWIANYKAGLEAYKDTLDYEQAMEHSNTVRQSLRDGLAAVNAHPAWNQLHEAYLSHDYAVWDQVREELQRLTVLQDRFKTLHMLRDKLAAHAPRWLLDLEREARSNQAALPPQNWMAAWHWKRTETWLKKHFESVRTEQLYSQIYELRAREGRLIDQLVSATTWLEQLNRTSDNQRRSLRAWAQTMRRIGKGTGKYAAKHRADAKKEMEICRTAVPVWIMPISRVIESLKPTEDLFDVVIVDESSQCDVFAWSVLYRAKKVVVVGDDRQISPEGVGKDQAEVNMLIERHLIGIPQKERFTLQDSLYDMALRVFPGQQLMLKEHFRCAPEIIQFCNDNFYGAIEPLRIPTAHERLNPPVVPVRVIDGYRDEGSKSINEPEAILLANKVAELCKMPEYQGKTFGVISLQGKDQACFIELKLRELIGESEMISRNMICGDAYSFQGDERDVMLLSLVAAPNVHNAVLNKRTDEQRFNVAVSRARDQLWLFYSIDLKDLNPTCMRYKLLQYCLDPQRTRMEMEKAEDFFARYGSSKFHKDVYRMIAARGYRAIPEYKIGAQPYRIDIVIEGQHSRLAVECDGDAWHGLERWEADFERQTILERVGWNFWRIRGSEFYRNREKALQSLWSLLHELGIEPVTKSGS